MRAFRSLRALTGLFTAALVAAVVGTGFAIVSASDDALVRLVDQRIATAAAAAAVAGTGERTSLPTAQLVARLDALSRDRDTGEIGMVLFDGAGRRLGGNVTLRRMPPPGFADLRPADAIKGLSAGRAYTVGVGEGRWLTVIGETEPVDHFGGARLRIYLIGFGSMLLIVALGLFAFARLIERRIGAMRATAAAIVAGDMQRRVPIDGDGGAFDQQAEAFNTMLDRIAGLMRGIADVSSDVAHDLRAPLARLRGQLVRIERRAAEPALREELAAAIAQSDAILGMFAAVLRIAEVEEGARRAGFVPLDLARLTADVAEMMAPVAAESGHRLHAAPLPPMAVQGDPQLLTQLFINLIANATRHTPSGTAIRIEGRSAAGVVAVVTVSDDGPGIPEAERGLALRRFGRLDRSRSTAGHGLGLPLAASVARLHHGELALEDAAPGLRVVLRLPLRQGAATPN